jgi:C4-dicarboxylate transporter
LLSLKPLRIINSPYLLMIAAYFVACLMSLAVSSATGLGVLLMATLFPVMVNVGISRGAAAAICASPAAIIFSPTSGDVVLAAKPQKCRSSTSRLKPRCRSPSRHYLHGDRPLFLAALSG